EGTDNLRLFESLMLTREGFVAEATVDNIFCVVKQNGWQENPSKVKVLTPIADYCLKGITRSSIMTFAKRFGYTVTEVADLMPIDLIGPDRECFMTGTGAGIMPIVNVYGKQVGNGKPGEITKRLLREIEKAMANPAYGLSIEAGRTEVSNYIKSKKSPVIM
ncbi:MAG: aminotransferase class IV, partial [Candidatus Eisenbacteria bacterium]